jgi:Zn finger protein HypA/HybF involved in hydrogenase expression
MKSVVCNECTNEFLTNKKSEPICPECGSHDTEFYETYCEELFDNEWEDDDDFY